MKKLGLILLVVLLLAVLAAGVGAYALYSRVNQPFRGYDADAQLVEIPTGSGTRTIGERLISAGVVRDELTYRAALWLSGDARRLQAGEYRFDRPMTAREVLAKLARGEVDLVQVTFREGLTIAEMAAVFESQGLGPAAAFRDAAVKGASLIHEVDAAATDLEGYLFPETYAVSRRIAADQLVRAMVMGGAPVSAARSGLSTTARMATPALVARSR